MTYGESFAAAVREYLAANRLASLGQINGKMLADLADRFHESWLAEQRPGKRAPTPSGARPLPKAERDALYGAFCLACGFALSKMTPDMKRCTALALLEIRAVEPQLTPEMITDGVGKYRRKFSETKNFSPKAVAKWWPDIMGSAQTASAKRDVYQEPANWHSGAVARFGEPVADNMKAEGWKSLDTYYRREIIKHIPA